MKQSIAILLTLLLLSACSAPAPDNQQQLQFYYCTVDSGFDADSSAIRAESRECNSLTNVEEILTVYLAGPQSADLCSPFPAALHLVSVTTDAPAVSITLSRELSDLTKLDLTMACACIAMTVMALTGTETVHISAEDALLNGQQTITMNAETLQLLDLATEGQ